MRLAKHSPHLLSLLTLALTVAGCFTLAQPPNPPLSAVGEPDLYGTRRLHHKVIATGDYSPLGDVALAIHDWDEWAAIKQRLRTDWDAEPDLDRSTVIYAAVPAGVDYSVRVDSVYSVGGLISERSYGPHLVGGEIVVTYTVVGPGDGCVVRPASGMPYQVVVVGVTFDQEALFTEAYEEVDCP